VASFQADNSTAWFLFNETWSCNDVTPSKPYVSCLPSKPSAVANVSIPPGCHFQPLETARWP
jgi:hypothetical protein